jgi:hypothetical protein
MMLSNKTSDALDVLVGACFDMNRTMDRMTSIMQNVWSMPQAADIFHHKLAHLWPLLADEVSGFKDQYNMTTVYPETHRDGREYKNLFDMMSVLLKEVEGVYEIVRQTYYIAKENRDFNANVMLQDFMRKLTIVISQIITLRDKAERMSTDYDTYDFHIKDWGIVGVEL